jgi:hypothetical protein
MAVEGVEEDGPSDWFDPDLRLAFGGGRPGGTAFSNYGKTVWYAEAFILGLILQNRLLYCRSPTILIGINGHLLG